MENADDHNSDSMGRRSESADALTATVLVLAVLGALVMLGVGAVVTALG